MGRHLPPLNALRAFESAARHNSFTGAAAELNVSHAAISRHVRALEARLGVTLFIRASRGVALTPAGDEYLRAVSAAFDEIAAATSALTTPEEPQIRVNAHPAFAARWLLRRLDGFRRTHPGYAVALEATPSLVDLMRDDADLAICNGEATPPRMVDELLVRARLIPVCAPQLVETNRKLAPAELKNFVLLHDEEDGSTWRRWFEAAGVEPAGTTRGVRILESGLAIDAAIAGQGVALADDFLVADDIAAGRLVCVCAVALSAPDCNYYLRSLPAARRRKPVAAFRSWLLSETERLRADR